MTLQQKFLQKLPRFINELDFAEDYLSREQAGLELIKQATIECLSEKADQLYADFRKKVSTIIEDNLKN